MKKVIVLFIICLFCSISINQVHAQATHVGESGGNITISAYYELVGDASTVTSGLVADWQSALDEFYNDAENPFTYKCYDIDFDLQITNNNSDIESGQETHKVQVINTTANIATQNAYDEHGMYTRDNWEKYDEANGTNLYDVCSEFTGSYYDIECANASQWFKDNGIKSSRSLAYAYYGTADYDGNVGSRNIVMSNNNGKQVFAHEVGHNLGFKHSEGGTDLMNRYAGDFNQTIPIDNLQEMLDNMMLECRLEMAVEEVNVNGQFTNVAGALWDWQEQGNIKLTVETNKLQLEGQGTKYITDFKNEPLGFSADHFQCSDYTGEDGTFSVSGNISRSTSIENMSASVYEINTTIEAMATEKATCVTEFATLPFTWQHMESAVGHGMFYDFDAYIDFLEDVNGEISFNIENKVEFDSTGFLPTTDMSGDTSQLKLISYERFKK